MAKIWDQAAYEQAYFRRLWDVNLQDYRTIPYGLEWMQTCDPPYGPFIKRLSFMQNSLVGFSLGSDLLVVGAGFGGLMKSAIDAGATPSNVWGCDTSPYIVPNLDTEVAEGVDPSRILNLDVSAGPSAFKAAGVPGNGRFSWLISELVIESLQTDQEIADFASDCDAMQQGATGGVAHIFTSELPQNRWSLDDQGQPKDPHATARAMGLVMENRGYWQARLSGHWMMDLHGGAHPEATEGDPAFIGKYGVDYFGVWNPQQGAWL